MVESAGIRTPSIPVMNTFPRWLVALGLALLAAPPLSAQEAASGTLRERWKQRVETRRANAEVSAPALGPGTHALDVSFAGHRRHALVHLPPRYDAARAVPVVFAFHGGGGSAQYMADDSRYGWISKADEEGFAVVFPGGYSKFPGGRLATWNAGACCGAARDQQVDDVGFVRLLLDRVAQQVSVDRQRLFATGMSNGAMMAYRLACEMADVFQAVAAVAGTEAVSDCRPARPLAVLHIHARDDTHVLFGGGAGPDAFRDAGQVTDFTSVPETVSRWVTRNRCDASEVQRKTWPGASCETHSRCAAGVRVDLCVTDSGGHSWPGGGVTRRGKAPSSQALSATEEAWAFFQAASRR